MLDHWLLQSVLVLPAHVSENGSEQHQPRSFAGSLRKLSSGSGELRHQTLNTSRRQTDFGAVLARRSEKCLKHDIDVVGLRRRNVRRCAVAQSIGEGPGLAVEVYGIADLGDLRRGSRLTHRPDLGKAGLVPFSPAFLVAVLAAVVDLVEAGRAGNA